MKVIRDFADKSLEIKPEEKREIDINQRKTTKEVVRSMNQPQKKEPEPAPAVQA